MKPSRAPQRLQQHLGCQHVALPACSCAAWLTSQAAQVSDEDQEGACVASVSSSLLQQLLLAAGARQVRCWHTPPAAAEQQRPGQHRIGAGWEPHACGCTEPGCASSQHGCWAQVADEAKDMLAAVDPEAAQANDLTRLFSSSPRFPDVVACTEAVAAAEVP